MMHSMPSLTLLRLRLSSTQSAVLSLVVVFALGWACACSSGSAHSPAGKADGASGKASRDAGAKPKTSGTLVQEGNAGAHSGSGGKGGTSAARDAAALDAEVDAGAGDAAQTGRNCSPDGVACELPGAGICKAG